MVKLKFKEKEEEALHNILLDSVHYAKSSLTSIFSRSFAVSCVQLSILGGPGRTKVRFPVHRGKRIPPGPPSIDNGAHGIKKLLLNTQVINDFS